jgi:hypothetical protein
MEYQELVQAQLQDREREFAASRLVSEARRLYPVNGRRLNPAARFDSIVIRASEGAKARQERRIGSRTPSQMA